MRPIALPLLLAFLLAGPTAAAGPGSDIGKFVPADAIVYVTADGLDPVEGAAGAFLENIMPGAGQILDGMLLGRARAMTMVDRNRPVAVWMLASGATVIAVPTRDTDAFVRLAREGVGAGDGVTAVSGYGIVTKGGPVDIAALLAHPTAAAPAIGGQVRGFVELGRVMAARLGDARSDLTPLLGNLEALPRVDFALAASHERVELNATIPAVAGTFIATLAQPALPAIQNRFLDALPADAAMVFATSAPERMVAVSEALFASVVARVPARSKQQAMMRRMRRQAKMWTALSHGDSAIAVSMPRGPESVSVVQAFSCPRPRHTRILMHKMMRHLPRGTAPMPVDVKYLPRAEQIGDVAVDQLVMAAPGGATRQASAGVARFMQGPVRYAFLREAAVTTYGVDGLEGMRGALAAIGSGVVAPGIAKAIPAGALLAVAVRPGAFGTDGSSGDEYATFAVVPRGTALDLRVVVPAGALPRRGFRQFVQPPE